MVLLAPVTTGVRRLRALRDVKDPDTEVPCYVRDVNDEEAGWLALAENLDRDDLSPIEEARAYAKHVEVRVDGEMVPFDEHIKGGERADGPVVQPGGGNSTIQSLAEKINPGTNQIRYRLGLLTLPEDVQQQVENDQLKLKPARIIARLRKIPDPDYRNQTMWELATDPRFAGDGSNIDELRETVQSKIDRYEREQEKEEQRLQEFRDLVEERAATTSAWIRLRDNPNRQQIYSH
jgi:ParB-like chromosome segregation protein Spo0J